MVDWLALVFKAVICGLLAAVLLLALAGCASAPPPDALPSCKALANGEDYISSINEGRIEGIYRRETRCEIHTQEQAAEGKERA